MISLLIHKEDCTRVRENVFCVECSELHFTPSRTMPKSAILREEICNSNTIDVNLVYDRQIKDARGDVSGWIYKHNDIELHLLND